MGKRFLTNGESMIIKDWQIKEQGESTEVSAEVDGFRLWFRAPRSYRLSGAADPFFAAALLPAMVKAEKLEIDPQLPLSPKLLENADKVQEIFHCWNPMLKLVSVTATMGPAEPTNSGVLSFFSGGVDSTFTFLKRNDDISHVVYIHGFEFYEDDRASVDAAIGRNSRFAQAFGKTLIPIETNLYPFGYRYNLSRNLTSSSWLGGVAMLLGFPRAYVPASMSYNQLLPVGDHPLVVPLWCNEGVDVVHDGSDVRRIDKLMSICQSEVALANLLVCFDDLNVNCGKCAKCLRTMIALKLLGVSTPAFGSLPPARSLRRGLRFHDDVELVFIRENIELASRAGDCANDELARVLQAAMRRAELKQAAKTVDAAFLGGFMKRMSRRVARIAKPGDREIDRVSMTPSKD